MADVLIAGNVGKRIVLASQVDMSTFNSTDTDYELIDFADESIGLSRDELTSRLADSDRNQSYLQYGNSNVNGDINTELIFGMFDETLLESLLFSAWTTDVLKNGTTKNYLSVEKGFTDVAKYFRYTGCLVNTLDLDVRPNAIVTARFGLVGKSEASVEATSIAPSAAVNATSGSDPIDSFSGTVTVGGSSSSLATQISLKIDNKLQDAFAIGSRLKQGIIPGVCRVSGTLSLLFNDTTEYDKFVAGTESSLSFVLSDGTNTYTFSIPSIYYFGETPKGSGQEGPVVHNLPFVAKKNTSLGATISVTRA